MIEQGTDPWLPPCTIENLPFADYLAIDAASSSGIKTILTKSPKHVKVEKSPTKAQGLGTLTHALLLEPHRRVTWQTVERDVIAVRPPGAGKGSNAAKRILYNWLEQTTGIESTASGSAEGTILSARIKELEPKLDEMGLIVCDQKDYDTARTMRDNVLAKSIGKVLFASGRSELTKLVKDPRTGVLCKIRIDFEPEGHEILVDLKTAESAAFQDFSAAASRYAYHVQQAFYQKVDALERDKSERDFLFCVVESSPPYDVAFYPLESAAIDKAKNAIDHGLSIWARCQDADFWPGYGYDWTDEDYTITTLSLRPWAL